MSGQHGWGGVGGYLPGETITIATGDLGRDWGDQINPTNINTPNAKTINEYLREAQEGCSRLAGPQELSMDGSKPVVVCNGGSVEAKDMDDAQAKAEELANKHSATAYILKPVKKVSPKREVVTSDIP